LLQLLSAAALHRCLFIAILLASSMPQALLVRINFFNCFLVAVALSFNCFLHFSSLKSVFSFALFQTHSSLYLSIAVQQFSFALYR
jgi:hypothetical protein